MGFVSVKAGWDAVENAEKLVEQRRIGHDAPLLTLPQIKTQLRGAVDKVMSEGSLYDEELAALAIKQAQGDLIEASFLLRAYKTTLERKGYSQPILGKEMRVLRRISSTFKDVPGGQILGESLDYSLRLLNFNLMEEKKTETEDIEDNQEKDTLREFSYPKVSEILRKEGIVVTEKKEEFSFDITRESIVFPAPRSAILQSLARGEEGAMLCLAYSSLRGYGPVHPTIAELRRGYLPVRIKHPITGETVKIGEIRATECEAVVPEYREKQIFGLGYGLVLGYNERKAISMAVLDKTLQSTEHKSPSEDEEFVLYHIDGIDSSGFVEHLKLPHYIFFQSDLDRLRKIQEKSDTYAKK
ncbi:carbon-phosphorus lyase complex subunit PhnI [Patescibacteria group bacterium]|nr:carbon-phosphorus lyase complex subunit PhnI [Patescibacteria group bacterium]